MYQSGASGGSGGAGSSDSNAGGGYSRSPTSEAATLRGGGGGVQIGREDLGLGKDAADAVDAELLNKSLDTVRHRVKHYRMYLKPPFQVKPFKRGAVEHTALRKTITSSARRLFPKLHSLVRGDEGKVPVFQPSGRQIPAHTHPSFC